MLCCGRHLFSFVSVRTSLPPRFCYDHVIENMGCASMKGANVTSELRATGAHYRQNTTHSEDDGSIDNDFVTAEEARAYVQQELAIDGVRARRMVMSVSKGDRNKVSSVEIVLLNERIKEIKEKLAPKFEECDPDDTGFVTPEVAVDIILSEFQELPETNVRAMVEQFDQDANNQVDFCEFIEFYAFIKSKRGELETRFDELDVDKSGDLDTEELIQVLIHECSVKEAQARALVVDFDLDKNGTLDKREFMTMWMKLFG